jgi:hypothetical protein
VQISQTIAPRRGKDCIAGQTLQPGPGHLPMPLHKLERVSEDGIKNPKQNALTHRQGVLRKEDRVCFVGDQIEFIFPVLLAPEDAYQNRVQVVSDRSGPSQKG